MRCFLFGANSVIGNAVVDGLSRRFSGLELAAYTRTDISRGLNEIISFKGPSIAVVSIGVMHGDLEPHSPIRTQMRVNYEIPKFIIDSLVECRELKELHVISSLMVLKPRRNLFGYYASKLCLDLHCQELSQKSRFHMYIWRMPFTDSPINAGRRRTPILNATPEEITKALSISPVSDGGVVYLNATQRIVAKVLSSWHF